MANYTGANVIVAGGQVTNAVIVAGGSGYTGGGSYFFDQAKIGAGNGAARLTVLPTGLQYNFEDTIQITGIGTATDGLFRVETYPAANKISLHTGTGDPAIFNNQYALNVGPSIVVSSDTYDSATKVTTFNCSTAHGLVSGNKFRVFFKLPSNTTDNSGWMDAATQFPVLSTISITCFF